MLLEKIGKRRKNAGNKNFSTMFFTMHDKLSSERLKHIHFMAFKKLQFGKGIIKT